MPLELFDGELDFKEVLQKPILAWESTLRTAISKPQANTLSTATNLDQPDLFYFESVFVTAGHSLDAERGVPVGWNKNDEFFDNLDVWMARKTPEDKQLNLHHDCANLIGHITDVFAEDLSGAALEDGEIAPPDFNLVTKAVLYRVWWTGKQHDEAKEQLVASIIEELPDNKWKVSMECLFSAFDYALLNQDGSVEIVKRTSANAKAMTKALRITGGSGEFNGRRIARVPRNMTFSGKGLVANPANSKSVIRANTILPELINEKVPAVYEKPTLITKTEPKPMELETVKAELAAAKTALAELQAKQNESEQKRVQELTAALDQEKQAKAALETSMKSATEQAKEAAEKLAAKNKELETSLAQAQASIAEAALKQTKTERTSKVVDALKLELAKAETLVENLIGLSDEQFLAHVDLLTATIGKPVEPPKQTNLPEPPKKTSLPEPKSAFAAAEGGKDADHSDVLNGAVADKEPDLSVAAEATKKAEAARNIIAKGFGFKAAAQV